MKTITKSTAIFTAKTLFLFLLAFTVITSCKKGSELKDDDDIDTPDFEDNYIPQPGFVYTYKFTSEKGQTYEMFKGNYGIKDSIGIKVSDIKTTANLGTETFNFRHKMYDLDGFTITTTYVPGEWEKYVNQLRKSIAASGGAVLATTLTGVPYNMFMDNHPQVGSVLRFTGPPTQYYFKARMGPNANSDVIETKQTITRNNGTAIRLETIDIPAGKFDCTVWRYEVDSKVETFLNGALVNTLNSKDKLTIWTKLGIGEVLTIHETKEGISTTELIRINR